MEVDVHNSASEEGEVQDNDSEALSDILRYGAKNLCPNT